MNVSDPMSADNEASIFKVDVELQNPCDYVTVPTVDDLQEWCVAALQFDSIIDKRLSDTGGLNVELSIVVRVVDEKESAELNQTYRQKSTPTNILSFPYDLPEELLAIPEIQSQPVHLGDLVVCETIVNKEAEEQDKTLQQHWAHLIVHGVLHLRGYDHIEDSEAEEMEALEVVVLKQLGFKNPYQ